MRSDLLAAKQTGKAEKVTELSKNLKRRQKIIKLTDKSEAGWLAVKEYQIFTGNMSYLVFAKL